MYNQNYPSNLFHSISTIIFILITSSTSLCDEDELFLNCSTPFSCGENSPNITYPFWGGNKSPECGLPGFELKCQQDDHLTIDIGSQTFRVLSIDDHSLMIAGDDLWDNICPENYQNISINQSLFPSVPDVQHIASFYSCDHSADLSVKNRFSCVTDGNTSNGFFTDEKASSVEASIKSCKLHIRVPFLGRTLEEFRSDLRSLDGLQNQRFRIFRLEYNINSTACLACVRSRGLCWSGTNSTPPTCLCREGTRRPISTSPRGLPAHFPHLSSSETY